MICRLFECRLLKKMQQYGRFQLLAIVLICLTGEAFGFLKRFLQKRQGGGEECLPKLKPERACFIALINDSRVVLELAKGGKVAAAKVRGAEAAQDLRECAEAVAMGFGMCCALKGNCPDPTEYVNGIAMQFLGDMMVLEFEFTAATGQSISEFVNV